jgi:hypothetical protein
MPIWVVIVLAVLASFEILVIGLGIVDEIADRKYRAILKRQHRSRLRWSATSTVALFSREMATHRLRP